MNEDIIAFHDVSVSYGKVRALRQINAQIHCGSMTAIVGPNGAGKSTLLKAILGWIPLDTGRIMLGDDHIEHQHPRLSYVPQRMRADWDFPLTVEMVVEQGRLPALGSFRRFGDEDRELVENALRELELLDLRNRQIGELSGGQQQRMFLARAIAQGGDIFLLDEPFEGLDAQAIHALIETFHRWLDQHRTIVTVLHDLRMARRSFSHALLLQRELVASGLADEALSDDNVARAFSRAIPKDLPACPDIALRHDHDHPHGNHN